MSERIRSAPGHHQQQQQQTKKMPDLGPKKTLLVLVIVVGCFAVLWPKVFYPMLVGSAQQHMKPSDIDRMTGCCDVISDADVHTIKIMSELCSSLIQNDGDRPPSGKEIVSQCRAAVLATCGIDIAVVLQEQVRLGASVKQILEEIRSLNGSLCLKYNFGVSPWKLGVPHRVTVIRSETVKQERPSQLNAELIHPAFRERGRAIPNVQQQQQQPQQQRPVKSTPPPRIVEGRPGPIPGMRPPMGGAGHVVPPSTKGTSSMSVIMPIYTIGIVIFFTYTLMKLLFRKQPDHVGGSLYPPVEPDRDFRKDVFESQQSQRIKEGVASKLGVSELDQLRRRLRETELAMERIVAQMAKVPLSTKDERTLANGNVSNGRVEPDHSSVKVLGMEMTASCEGGQKWTRPDSPVTPVPHAAPVSEEPPQEIYLEGALPHQSKLLVADSATETQKSEENNSDPAVVLAGKMTLSVISLDSNEDEEPKKEEEARSEVVGVNGIDEVDESKYTTASNATAAEKDISDEEQNTDDDGIDGEAVEEIQNEEAPIFDNKHLTNNIDVQEEIESVAREFVENELNAALDEIRPPSITDEVKNELKDIDELLYDQIRKEEEAELQAVLAQKRQEEETISQEQEVAEVEYEEENVAGEQQSEITNEIEAKQEVALQYEEETIPSEQKSEITNGSEAKQEVAVEYEEESIPNEQKSEILNEIEAEQEVAVVYEEESIPGEQKSEVSNEIEAREEVAVEYEEEAIASEQKSEILNQIEANQEVAVEYEEEAIAKEQKSEISGDNEAAKEETAVVYEEEVVSKEQTAEESTTDQKQQINLNDFDSDEYEIEEYEVEVDDDEDVADEIVVVDDDVVLQNVPKK